MIKYVLQNLRYGFLTILLFAVVCGVAVGLVKCVEWLYDVTGVIIVFGTLLVLLSTFVLGEFVRISK